MRNYIAVVGRNADSAFGVWFPDIPGCFVAAADAQDITRKAIEALTAHLNGETPPSRAAPEIAALPRVRDAMREGAFLLAIPYRVVNRRLVRANISLDKGTLNAIDAAARERGMTRSAFIAEAAMNEITAR